MATLSEIETRVLLECFERHPSPGRFSLWPRGLKPSTFEGSPFYEAAQSLVDKGLVVAELSSDKLDMKVILTAEGRERAEELARKKT